MPPVDNVILLTGIFLSLLILFPLFYYLVYEPVRVFIRWVNYKFVFKLPSYQTEYLGKNFQFYQALVPSLKLRFENRVASFLNNKKFSGIGMEVTDDMKLFVAGAAIQLTFGLRNSWPTEFDNIVLHKESYQLASFQHLAMGHVSEDGIITLSWSNLQKGFANPADGINVGLHEMAHALYISSVRKGWNVGFAVHYDDYEKEAIMEWKKFKTGEDHFLRDYAYRNLYEFFAVCVEYFFEEPDQLCAAAPKMFFQMERLFRLDPRNHADPILHGAPVMFPSQTFPLPQYKPYELAAHVLADSKSFLFFIVGTACAMAGGHSRLHRFEVCSSSSG